VNREIWFVVDDKVKATSKLWSGFCFENNSATKQIHPCIVIVLIH
jgi:hypothetical protein